MLRAPPATAAARSGRTRRAPASAGGWSRSTWRIVLLVAGGITWYGERHAARPGRRAGQGARAARGHHRARGPAAHRRGRARRPRARSPTARRCSACWPQGQQRGAAAVPARAGASGQRRCLRGALGQDRAWRSPGRRSTGSRSSPPRAEQGGTFMALPATERVPLLGARARRCGDSGLTVYVRAAPGCAAGAHASARRWAREVRLIDYRDYTSGAGRMRSRRCTRRRSPTGTPRCSASTRRTPMPPACRCSPPAARPSRSSRRCCRRARSMTPRSHLVQQAAADGADARARSRCWPACVLGERVAGPVRAADGGRHAPRRGRLLRLHPARRRRRGRRAGAHHGGHAPQSHRTHQHAAAARGARPRRCSAASSRACTRSTRTASSAI